MLSFQDDILAGTTLVRAAINSPGYVAGVSGWSVNQDGSAEFNNVTYRGTFQGTNYVQNAAGQFFYSGTPAAGNLSSSNTNSPGRDQFGNFYLSGYTTYVPTGVGSTAIATQVALGGLSFWIAANMVSVANPWTTLGGLATFNGTPNFLQLVGGPNAADYIALASSVKVTGGFHYSGPAVAYHPGGTVDETWQTITLDAGWSLLSGTYAAPSYRLLPDGNLQLTGLADFGSGQTVNHNLNNGNPLPAAYRPPTQKVYRSSDASTARGAVQIAASGVITFLASASTPARYCEIDGILPLNL